MWEGRDYELRGVLGNHGLKRVGGAASWAVGIIFVGGVGIWHRVVMKLGVIGGGEQGRLVPWDAFKWGPWGPWRHGPRGFCAIGVMTSWAVGYMGDAHQAIMCHCEDWEVGIR
jgi:hypothetical protein